MFNYKALYGWLKGFSNYLLKKLGYIVVLFLICYGIHHFSGLELNLALVLGGAIVMFMGCESYVGSTMINNDYNYRMVQITNPVIRFSEEKNKSDSFRFLISCAIVGGSLLFIGFYM